MSRQAQFTALLCTALISAAPVAAQDAGAGAEKVNQVIVYGNDKCEQSSPDEIIVCSRLPESERFRVPKIFRGSPADPRNDAWANKVVSLERVGRFGTDSCSPSGLGGFTGCTQALIAGANAERRAADKTDWQAMIADERARRLAGIDAAADQVESAVVAQEKEMAERQRKAAELEERGGAPAPDTPPPSDKDPEAEAPPMPPPR